MTSSQHSTATCLRHQPKISNQSCPSTRQWWTLSSKSEKISRVLGKWFIVYVSRSGWMHDAGFLTLWLPTILFRNCHLVPNKFFRFSSLVPNKIFGFSLLVPDKIWPSTFRRPPTVWFYFLNKVLVLCKSAIYLFCRELNSLQYGENSIEIAPIVFHKKF